LAYNTYRILTHNRNILLNQVLTGREEQKPLKKFKIKKPKKKNIQFIADTYNAMEGDGIEIYYDMKKGRIFIADYFQTFYGKDFRKISNVSESSRMASMTADYLEQEIERIKQAETEARNNPLNNQR
jgi:hypothetical protein